MVEKGFRGGNCHAIHHYAKGSNKYIKDYDKNKESYLMYWDVNNSYGLVVSQKLAIEGFNWVEETSQFNEDLIKIYNKDRNTRFFL